MKKNNQLRISYASAVHDDREKERVIRVIDEHRTIMGRETDEFEKRCAKYFGKKYGIMVNSGSSANLLALEILNLPTGSEVITPALTFSTTVAPLLQKGLTPVLVDVVEGTYNIDLDRLEDIITKKTKLLMIPLLIGNVIDLQKLSRIAKKHNLYVILDSCDTFASTFDGNPVGKYGDIVTTSFYGSHIITGGGGGGMLMVDNKRWDEKARIFRGWGRSSSTFKDSESISKRFKVKLDSITYDAKFIFSEVGYNFLPTEISAAFGNAQLDKLSTFKKIREKNFAILLKFFKNYERFFILPIQDKRVMTQWLAFPLTLRKDAPFSRTDMATFLEENNIQTRPIFTGNILRQPSFKRFLKGDVRDFPVAEAVMRGSILIGCHHGLQQEHMKQLKKVLIKFLEQYV